MTDKVTVIKEPPASTNQVQPEMSFPMTFNIMVNGIAVFTPDSFPSDDIDYEYEDFETE